MKAKTFFDLSKLTNIRLTPKYLQLANSIVSATEAGVIKKEFLLPSINELSYQFDISRDTIQRRVIVILKNRHSKLIFREGVLHFQYGC